VMLRLYLRLFGLTLGCQPLQFTICFMQSIPFLARDLR
jgi:hypothetical protein